MLSGPLQSLGRGARRAPDLRLHQEPRKMRAPTIIGSRPIRRTPRWTLVRRLHEGPHLYVVPYCMGPIDSPFSRCGVEITDSAYVVLNMKLMTRMGRAALERIARDGTFVKGLHSTGDLNPDRRFIMHFPEELSIKSFGSGYGGNALLGKKCHALRIASWQARTEGWLAEHMLIVGIENPQGEIHYLACAFPSACGKTNLAMLIPPASYKGWKVWTVGDDIAWLHPGKDGRLYAINPESGYFGVVPGTNAKTNRNAYEMIRHDTIFTNVALTADNQPWWEGLTEGKPALDWQGRPYDPANGPAAHPNSRFTVAAKQNPAIRSWRTRPAACRFPPSCSADAAARWRRWCIRRATGCTAYWSAPAWPPKRPPRRPDAVGVVRRDPMAMKPFAGYNFGDYWAHWINVGAKLKSPPQIFTSTGSARMRRQVPVAGLRREPARAALDHRSLQGQGEARATPPSGSAACRRFGYARAWTSRRRARGVARRQPQAVARGIRRHRQYLANSASACRRRSRPNYAAALAPPPQ
jgi:hypothetical protein